MDRFFFIIIIVFLCLTVLVFIGGDGKHVVFNIWLYELFDKINIFPDLKLYSNMLGCISALSIPVLLAISLFPQKKRIRICSGILAVLFVAILVISAAGGGWIPALASVIFIFLVRGTKTALIFIGVLLVCIGATAGLWLKADWFEVALPFKNILPRFDFWEATLIALKSHPLTGLGLCGWWSSVHIVVCPGGPHNTYLQLYSDCGLLGLIALLLAIFIGVRSALNVLIADKTSPYYGVTLGFLAGCLSAFLYAIVENIFVVMQPVGEQDLAFTVPLVSILLAGLVLSSQKLLKDKY